MRHIHRLLILVLIQLSLASSAWALAIDDTLDSDDAVAVADTERAAITEYLRANLGEPYRLGATGGRQGFDCSGLVLRAYEAAGLAVPRLSAEQAQSGSPVALSKLRAGDLLFYEMRADEPGKLHVVVYIGDGHAIHASVKHNAVREIDITSNLWRRRLVAARTLL